MSGNTGRRLSRHKDIFPREAVSRRASCGELTTAQREENLPRQLTETEQEGEERRLRDQELRSGRLKQKGAAQTSCAWSSSKRSLKSEHSGSWLRKPSGNLCRGLPKPGGENVVADALSRRADLIASMMGAEANEGSEEEGFLEDWSNGTTLARTSRNQGDKAP